MELGETVQLNPCGVNRHKLAEKIIKRFRALEARLTDFKEDIRLLWVEFENLKDGETILGCTTKKEFCQQHLNRTPRAVRYMLNGGNGDRESKGDTRRPTGETVSPVHLPSASEIPSEIPNFKSITAGLDLPFYIGDPPCSAIELIGCLSPLLHCQIYQALEGKDAGTKEEIKEAIGLMMSVKTFFNEVLSHINIDFDCNLCGEALHTISEMEGHSKQCKVLL